MFYHNHRRYESGKRKGKAPLELLTGEPLEAQWWELLLQQVNARIGRRWHHAERSWNLWVLQRRIADKRTLKLPNR
jgi:hypothetical protein